jgi:hypothetical protein
MFDRAVQGLSIGVQHQPCDTKKARYLQFTGNGFAGVEAPPVATFVVFGILRVNACPDRLGLKRSSIEHFKSYRTVYLQIKFNN